MTDVQKTRKIPKDGNWDYYKIGLKLYTDQFGTCPSDASIYDEHLIKKHQKMADEANQITGKITKQYQKYVGTEIGSGKQLLEIQGLIRRAQQIYGIKEPLPNSVDECLEYAKDLDNKYSSKLTAEEKRATVFLRDKEGWPMISGHMILGNLKENLSNITNNGDKSITKYKSQVKEMMALDAKTVEHFLRPSEDVLKDKSGKPILEERAIRFSGPKGEVTALAASEVIPEGTEYNFHLRVRRGSPINKKTLAKLFDLGKNNGLGQWRGSGHKGAFFFRIKQVDYDPTPIPDGWN